MSRTNKYKQVRVTEETKPVKVEILKPAPKYSAGEQVSCHRKFPTKTILVPCIALQIEEDKHYMSHWRVLVKTDQGECWLDSELLTPINPADRP